MIIGKNFELYGNFYKDFYGFNIDILLYDLLAFFGFYFLIYGILKLLSLIDLKTFKVKNNKIINFIDDHFIIICIVFIILCRIPYLLAGFPFFSTRDTFDSACQFFNYDCSWSKDYLNLSNSNVFLNNHHPFLFTFLLGIFMSIKSYTTGAFLFILFQFTVITSIFVYLLSYMKKINVPFWIRLVSLLFIGVTPIIEAYSFMAVKDVFSASFTLLYAIFLLRIVRNYDDIYDSKINIIIFILVMTLVMLFRHNGVITILLSYPLLFILYKKHYKKLFVVLIIPIVILISFNQTIYHVFDASKGSKSEMLYMPFLQVARVVKANGNDAFDKKDQHTINKVLDYNIIGSRYNPNIGDAVKYTFKKEASNEDIKNFLVVWSKNFFKYPLIYIDHFFNATYKYYYPNLSKDDIGLNVSSEMNNYYRFKEYRIAHLFNKKILSINNTLKKVPIISLIYNIGLYTWILFISCYYAIINKRFKYLIVYAVFISVFLVCLVSPLNGSIRYGLPIILGIPIFLTINYLVLKEKKS